MPSIMKKTLNLSTSLENITNIDNSYRTSFPYFLIIFFFYLLLLLVVSNLIAGLIRGYRRSLSYLRINIILSLNHALVEIFNTYVTFMSCLTMWSSFSLIPYWVGFLADLLIFFLINLSLGLSIIISVCRLLMIIKFEAMIELEPEELFRRIMIILVTLISLGLVYPSYSVYTTGYVAPHVSFYTGLESCGTLNPHIVVAGFLCIVCIAATIGPHVYGEQYLKKHHALSAKSEKADSIKNIISMKTVILAIIIISGGVALAVLFSLVDQRQMPLNIIISDTISTLILIKFFHNPEIQEYSRRKMSQKKTNIMESFKHLKSRILKLKTNKVGIQNAEE